jgi:hypothetical protein
MALNKIQVICSICFVLAATIGCTAQGELEKETAPVATRTIPASAVPTDTSEPEPTTVPMDLITSMPFPAYLSGVFPEPASIYNISSAEYLELLRQYEYFLKEPSVCASVRSYHLLERGDAPSSEEFLNQMYLVVDEKDLTTPNVIVSSDIFGSDVFDDSGEFLFRIPDGEVFNVCWPADLSGSGVHTATFIFTKTSGTVESYTWSFITEE